MEGHSTPEKVKEMCEEFVDLASPSLCPEKKRPNLIASPTLSKTETADNGQIFALKFYGASSEVAQILFKLSSSACSSSVGVRSTVPMNMPEKEKECTFVVTLDSEAVRRDCNVDAYGKWFSLRANTEFVSVENGHAKLASRNGVLKRGCHADYKISHNMMSHFDLGNE
ncbi:MAG: hypothetical protein GY820_28430, partial [Gammaproteobacteria bacterium]|nr:hypothetical protein [Gammaproteobacteria bacterium]